MPAFLIPLITRPTLKRLRARTPTICATRPSDGPESTDTNSSAKPQTGSISAAVSQTPSLFASLNLSLPETVQSSALDELSPSLKFNAIAEALAREHDLPATLRVLSEMNDSGIELTLSTQAAIVDSAVTSHTYLRDILTSISPAGYGSMDPSVSQETPEKEPIDPTRATDLTLTTSFLTVVGGALSAEALEPLLFHQSADEATTLLLLTVTTLAADRYLARAPLWRRLRRGFRRLFTDNPERAARVDAATFLVSYILGLPWICFQPDGRRALRWYHGWREGQTEAGDDTTETGFPVVEDADIDRCLIWLVAGVAAEHAFDNTLICSNLNAAREFVSKVRLTRPVSQRWTLRQSENRIRQAVSCALEIVTAHRGIYDELRSAMFSGASTGECVALLTKHFS